jgi:bifunctional DNase/RNase
MQLLAFLLAIKEREDSQITQADDLSFQGNQMCFGAAGSQTSRGDSVMIEMYVAAITLDELSGVPVLVLADTGRHYALPIWIGPAECNAIIIALGDKKPARPMTHDLMFNTIADLGWQVRSIEINDLANDVYFATIRLSSNGQPGVPECDKAIDARPSDAIALALRAQVPIYVSDQILASAGIPTDEQGEFEKNDREQFKKFVQNIKASDFNEVSSNEK